MSPDNFPVPRASGTGMTYQDAAPVESYPTTSFAPDDDEGGLDWRRYVAGVLRFKWLVLAVTIAGTGAGIVASRFVKPTFMAEATILVPEGSTRNGPIQPDLLFSESGGWVELIKTSYIVLDNVVRELRLYVQPSGSADSLALSTFGLKSRFRPGTYEVAVSNDGRTFELRNEQGLVRQRGAVGDSIGPDEGFAWVPPPKALAPGRKVHFKVVQPRDVARRLQQEVNARINERGASMLRVSLQGENPAGVAATVNSIASGFVDSARALSITKHRELTRTLKLQLDSAERRLGQTEMAYEQFRVATYTLPRERATPIAPGVEGTSSPALDNYTKMRFELDALERDREALDSALQVESDSGIAAGELAYIGVVQQSPDLSQALKALTDKQAELTTLRLRYTDANPEVIRAVRDVDELRTRTIPDLVRGLLAQLAVRERELEGRASSAGQELKQIPQRTMEEQRLQRDMELATARYKDLQKQYQDALYAQAAEALGARVLDSAVVPTRPIRDEAYRVVVIAFVGSLGLALLVAIVLDRLDGRVRYPEEITRLGLPILGAVPRVEAGSNGGAIRSGAVAPVVEALRGIRLGLVHAHGAAGPLLVTLSSPGPGEGKTFVVSNLALAFAEAGHRTLLIDGDVRRGELHHLLDAKRKPGLTDYLQGSVPREDILQETRYNSLSFIGGGTRTHAAPELLSSPALGQLLVSVRSAYDVVLVDSPPLAAGVDPFVLGSATGCLVLVLRTGVTDREMAEAKLDMLDRLPVRILGAILNDVKPGGAYRYYGYHYYVDGYETRSESEDAAEATPALRAPKS